MTELIQHDYELRKGVKGISAKGNYVGKYKIRMKGSHMKRCRDMVYNRIMS